jgi:hypothetical protein
MKRRGILVALALVGAVNGVMAQTDFSGSWVFKTQESVSGNLYANGSPKSVAIKQAKSSITMDKTTAGQNGDVTTTETVGFDGKITEMKTVSGRKKTITGSWSPDKYGFTEVTLIYDKTDTAKLFHTVTDVWTIQGGQLQLDRKDENHDNGEIWESKAIYDKQ